MRLRWTFEREMQFRKLHEQGLNDKEIARRMGVHDAAIWRARKRRGLPNNAYQGKPTVVPEKNHAFIQEKWSLPGWDLTRIARELGLRPDSVRRAAQRLGLPPKSEASKAMPVDPRKFTVKCKNYSLRGEHYKTHVTLPAIPFVDFTP